MREAPGRDVPAEVERFASRLCLQTSRLIQQLRTTPTQLPTLGRSGLNLVELEAA